MTAQTLPEEWREEAALLRKRGLAQHADMIESMAGDLDERLQAEAEELLRPRDASEWSGYNEDVLRQMSKRGDFLNYGRKGSPLYKRSELPRKARVPTPKLAIVESSAASSAIEREAIQDLGGI